MGPAFLRGVVLAATLASLMIAPVAAAQSNQSAASVDDLKAPPSPAFVVLGIAPTTVERPDGVRPLIMSVISASKDSGFPKNYSVEFAPYWLGTPTLTFDDYYSSGPKNLFRQLSVSFATTPLGDNGADGTGIGFGVRTLPLPGHAHPRLNALRAELATKQSELRKLLSFFATTPRQIDLLNSAQTAAGKALEVELNGPAFKAIVTEMTSLQLDKIKIQIRADLLEEEAKRDAALPEAERKKRAEARKPREEAIEKDLEKVTAALAALGPKMLAAVKGSKAGELLEVSDVLRALSDRLEPAHEAAVSKLTGEVSAIAAKIEALDDQRVGPMLAVAGAVAWRVPGNDAKETAVGRRSLWFTPGYRFLACTSGAKTADACTSSVDVLAVARWLNDPASGGPSTDTWELGARLVWQPVKPFAASVEWLGRSESDSADDPGTRLVGVAEYQINDTAYVYASFGRDFAEKGTRRTLVSTFGLNLGFGKQPILTTPIAR